MNDNDEKSDGAKIIKDQLTRRDYRVALRTRHKPVPIDKQSEELLKRLDEAERNK